MVELVIPFAGDCPHRQRAFDWIRRRYAEEFPDWNLSIGTTGEPWIKAHAVMPAIQASTAEIIVVADADCWTTGLPRAIERIEAGASWAVPHGRVYRLTESSSQAFMGGGDWENQTWDRKPYVGLRGGGFVIAPRQTLIDVPLDPSFIGWGQEDASWGLALSALAGAGWRGNAPLIHLWHPPQEYELHKWGSVASKRRHQLYVRARRKPQMMRDLLEGT